MPAITANKTPVSKRPLDAFFMRKYKDTLVFIFTAGIFFAAFLCPADGRVPRIENRFLFIVDTSSAMRSRTNGIEQAVVGLLKSNMHDQLRKGDTIGLWTARATSSTISQAGLV